MSVPAERAAELRREIAHHNQRYYVHDDPEIADDAYDALLDEESGRRQFRIYGDSPVHDDEEGTDLCAVHHGRIAVTPLHFDLTAEHGLEALRDYDLGALLEPAAEELTE